MANRDDPPAPPPDNNNNDKNNILKPNPALKPNVAAAPPVQGPLPEVTAESSSLASLPTHTDTLSSAKLPQWVPPKVQKTLNVDEIMNVEKTQSIETKTPNATAAAESSSLACESSEEANVKGRNDNDTMDQFKQNLRTWSRIPFEAFPKSVANVVASNQRLVFSPDLSIISGSGAEIPSIVSINGDEQEHSAERSPQLVEHGVIGSPSEESSITSYSGIGTSTEEAFDPVPSRSRIFSFSSESEPDGFDDEDDMDRFDDGCCAIWVCPSGDEEDEGDQQNNDWMDVSGDEDDNENTKFFDEHYASQSGLKRSAPPPEVSSPQQKHARFNDLVYDNDFDPHEINDDREEIRDDEVMPATDDDVEEDEAMDEESNTSVLTAVDEEMLLKDKVGEYLQKVYRSGYYLWKASNDYLTQQFRENNLHVTSEMTKIWNSLPQQEQQKWQQRAKHLKGIQAKIACEAHDPDEPIIKRLRTSKN